MKGRPTLDDLFFWNAEADIRGLIEVVAKNRSGNWTNAPVHNLFLDLSAADADESWWKTLGTIIEKPSSASSDIL